MVDKIQGFKKSCGECLDVFSLGKLRAYGRSIGVDRPTKKTKGQLIADILAIHTGELAPIERSKLGAPVKDDYVDPTIEEAVAKQRYVWFASVEPKVRLTYIESAFNGKTPLVVKASDNSMTFEEYHAQEIFKGQLEVIDGVPCLVDKSGRLDKERLCVSVDLIRQHGLRAGDVVNCHTYEKLGVRAARNVLSVNSISVGTETRFEFDSEEVAYSNTRIQFQAGKVEDFTSKFFNYLLPIGFGQRCLVTGAPKTGKSTFLRDTAKLLCSSNVKAEILVLLVEQTPELISSYRQFMKDGNLVATSYEDDPEMHVFAAEFLLKRAKRFAEMGKDVILIVDSLTQVAKAYNETDFCLGGKTLPCGLENRTLHYIKKYFGSSRNFVKNGSLSIIATAAMETGDAADDFLRSELSSVANAKIALSDKLARQRIFPAIDFAGCVNEGEALMTKEASEAEKRFYAKVLPKLGDAEAHSFLDSCANFDEFYQKIKNAD